MRELRTIACLAAILCIQLCVGTAYGSLDSGLVGYWRFDEASGDTAFDSSGSNHHMRLYGPTHTPAIDSNGVDFDGINDSGVVADHADFDFGNGDFSVSIWFQKRTRAISWGTALLGNWCTGARPGTNEWLLNGAGAPGSEKPVFHVEDSASKVYYTATCITPADSNVWNHLVGVKHGDVIRIYLNGQLEDTTLLAQNCRIRNTGRNLQFAAFYDYSRWYNYRGKVDCARIYRRALSGSEIYDLYLHVVGYWNFNENTGTTAHDLSGYENSGTLNNGPTWTTGKEGYGLDFDGSDDYVSVPNASQYQFGSKSFSVCAWVNVDSANNDTLRPVVVKDNYNYSEHRIAFYLCTSHSDDGNHGCYENYGEHCDEGKPFFAITDGNMESGGKTILAWGSDILTSGWHHLVGVRNTAVDSIFIYVDGVKRGAAYDTLSAMINTAPLLFGADPISPSPLEFYDGKLDGVRLYGTALSPNDITYLVEGGLGKRRIVVPRPARLVKKAFPTKLGLQSILPNPARNSVRIQYTIPAEKNQKGEYASTELPVKIEVYSVEGRLARTLVNGRKVSGLHYVGWDGTGPGGGGTRAGVYMVRFSFGKFQQNLRLILNR